MQLIYLQRPDGFLCGDARTRRTAFAYATSTHANAALRRPEAVAAEMMRAENECPCRGWPMMEWATERDERHMATLEMSPDARRCTVP